MSLSFASLKKLKTLILRDTFKIPTQALSRHDYRNQYSSKPPEVHWEWFAQLQSLTVLDLNANAFLDTEPAMNVLKRMCLYFFVIFALGQLVYVLIINIT